MELGIQLVVDRFRGVMWRLWMKSNMLQRFLVDPGLLSMTSLYRVLLLLLRSNWRIIGSKPTVLVMVVLVLVLVQRVKTVPKYITKSMSSFLHI